MMNNKTTLLAVLGVSLGSMAFDSDARGAVLLQEGFDYIAGSLAGQSGGVGFEAGSSYAVTLDAGATGSTTVTAGSLVFSDYATTGNKLSVSLDATNGSGANTISADRAVGFSSSGDLWVSFLYQRDRADDNNSNASRLAEIRIDGSGTQFGTQPKRSGSQGGALRYDGSSNNGGGNWQDGDVRLFIAKFADTGTNGAAASMWFLDEAGYDAVKAGGITEAELGTASISDSLAPGDARSVTSGDVLRLLGSSSQVPFGFDVDELYYGTTIDSVTTVPEPGSLALSALSSLLILARRRSL